MKKIAFILGAVVLTAGSVTAASSFADASTASALATSLVSQAKATGGADAGKTDNLVETDVAAAVTALIQQAVAAGTSNADIQAAVTEAMNDKTLTAPEAAGIGAVNAELASLEANGPGGVRGIVRGGTGGGNGPAANPPSPPPPALAGSGYRGS